jgi:hypothetical protein
MRTSKYPWDEWMDGTEWTIWKGKDFEIKRVSMRNMLHQKCVDTPMTCEVHFRDTEDGQQGLTFRYRGVESNLPYEVPEDLEERRSTAIQRDDVSDDAIAALNRPVEP